MGISIVIHVRLLLCFFITNPANPPEHFRMKIHSFTLPCNEQCPYVARNATRMYTIKFLNNRPTSQNFAPYRGGGESQKRYRFRTPPRQVVEQCVQLLHGPHPPESEAVGEKKKKEQRKKEEGKSNNCDHFLIIRIPTHAKPEASVHNPS